MEPIRGKNLINGEWRDAERTFESENPSDTREVVGVFPQSSASDVDEAVHAARTAQTAWRRLSRIQRGEYIDQLAQLMKRDLDEMTALCARDVGKQWNEARADVIESIHMAQFVAGYSRQPNGWVVSSEIPSKDAYMIRKPKGVAACIPPWNFPFAIPLWQVLPSVLEGNTAVLKPSSYGAACGDKLARLFHEAGFPAGVVNVVQGLGSAVGKPLVENDDVNVILFTGSWEVGKWVKQVCAAATDKFAACELGGKNQLLVLDDANIDLAVWCAIMSAYKTTNQRCVSVGRILVDRKVEAEFTEKFVALSRRVRVGNALSRDVFCGPLINQPGVEKFVVHNERAKEEGAEVLLDGGPTTEGDLQYGHFVTPFVYRMEYNRDSWVLNEEAFSPNIGIVPVDGLEQAVQYHNETPYGLSAAVITESFRNWRYCRDEMEVGLLYVNLPSIGAEVHLPFGGCKQSGNGSPGAATVIDAVTHRTAFTVNNSTEVAMAQGLSASVD
jgi:aldehyde dehydrogenase (NAD+)